MITKDIKENVTSLLRRYPETRDCDMKRLQIGKRGTS